MLRGTIKMRENNFYYLFVGLLVLLLLLPTAHMAIDRTVFPLLEIAFVLMLLIGVWSLRESRWSFYAGLALVGLAAALALASAALALPWLRLVQLANLGLFCGVSFGITMRHVLARGPITLNQLVGAMCAYLLLGILWAAAYFALHTAMPDAFALPADLAFDQFIYFSFVTLTTLGYGDITPVLPLARALAYLEAVIGQLYVAVLVAALVGRHVAEWQAPEAQA
jgi:hypothetical protein